MAATSTNPSAPPASSPERRIRYRLQGAHYELGQALRDAMDLPLPNGWRYEVELSARAAAKALAIMDAQR